MLFDAAFVAVFVGFAVVAGLVWPKMLNDRMHKHGNDLKKLFPKITLCDFAKFIEQEEDRRAISSYVIPTFMFAVIVAVGALMLVLDTVNEHDYMKYELLYGVLRNEAALRQAENSFLMIQSAFMGSFLWSLQYLLRRAQAKDIGPSAIYQICFYIVFGMTLAIFVNHLGSVDSNLGFATNNSLPVVGFFTGYFSIEMFERVTAMVFRRRRAAIPAETPPQLQVIEGIGDDSATRLRELWIDDAFTLSRCNPLEIYLKTPFSIDQCVDWVAQAQLLTLVKPENFEFLRLLGVRDIAQFVALTADDKGASLKAMIAEADANGAGDHRSLATLCSHVGVTVAQDLAYLKLTDLIVALKPDHEGGVSPCAAQPMIAAGD